VSPGPVSPPPVRPPSRPSTRKPDPASPPAAPPEPEAAGAEPVLVGRAAPHTADDLLADVLGQDEPSRERDPAAPRTQFGAFMGIRRAVNPEQDLMPTAPRLPRYVVAAITLIRNATGETQQKVIADALTGRKPLPAEVLDAAFYELYGYQRPQEGRRG
jgi:hypothetical protein